MNWFTTHDLLKRSEPFTYSTDYIVWYFAVAILFCVGIYFLNKYKTENRVKFVLIVLWATAVVIDLVKLIVNICTDFSIHGDLPLYVCSLFLYIMPFAIWGKGIFKTIGAAYICTIGVFGAIGNYIVPSVIIHYSLFSFYGFHTTLYHTLLLVTPLVMLCTGYFKFRFKDFGWQMLAFIVITLPVIPFNYITDSNYMYFNTGIFIEDFAAKASYAWPLILYVAYAAIMMVMQLIDIGLIKLVEITIPAIKKRLNKNQKSADNADAATEQCHVKSDSKNNNE